VSAQPLAHLCRVHLEQGAVARAAGRDHHMVDRCRQVLEEPLQGGRVVGVEGGGALRAEFPRRLLEPVGTTAGEDDIGTLGSSASGCFEPDTRAAADHDDGLSHQFRFTPGGHRSG
jgi:hypothetical protein